MTPPEPRLCHCGCLTPIVRKPKEELARFKARKFVSQSHYDAHRLTVSCTPVPDRICKTCGVPFGKRRVKSGKIERRRDYERRDYCPEHTSYKNGTLGRQAKPPTKMSPFNPETRLPDPRPLQTLRDNPKNESGMKRLPSLLEAERASGVTLEPVPIERFKRAAGRAKRLHPDFAAMLRGEAVWGPVAGEVTV